MYALGIETSCDETSAAVLTERFEVLSNIILSQDEFHTPYGGVVPELASRQHIKTIDAIVGEALARAGVELKAIDLFAVTQGPGLIGSLLVGLSSPRGWRLPKKPLVGMDHLEGHIEATSWKTGTSVFPSSPYLSRAATRRSIFWKRSFPTGSWAKRATTRPARPSTRSPSSSGSATPAARSSRSSRPKETKRHSRSAGLGCKDATFDFSFSGLKTAALKHIRESGITKERPRFADFLAGFEEAVARTLVDNLARAVDEFGPKSLILCGGVARNKRLRTRFQGFADRQKLPAFIPSPKMCTDNAAMVAALALEKRAAGIPASIDLDLDAYPR